MLAELDTQERHNIQRGLRSIMFTAFGAAFLIVTATTLFCVTISSLKRKDTLNKKCIHNNSANTAQIPEEESQLALPKEDETDKLKSSSHLPKKKFLMEIKFNN
uniref:Uncharacterized protein n=1 Tax=Glossina pallidipes TaxID=7398 RepID=A0A1B0AF22_GLOPL